MIVMFDHNTTCFAKKIWILFHGIYLFFSVLFFDGKSEMLVSHMSAVSYKQGSDKLTYDNVLWKMAMMGQISGKVALIGKNCKSR